MSNQTIFQASNAGNLERVQYLIERQNIDVNSRDTPGNVINLI